jgi:hypothetical protein
MHLPIEVYGGTSAETLVYCPSLFDIVTSISHTEMTADSSFFQQSAFSSFVRIGESEYEAANMLLD